MFPMSVLTGRLIHGSCTKRSDTFIHPQSRLSEAIVTDRGLTHSSHFNGQLHEPMSEVLHLGGWPIARIKDI